MDILIESCFDGWKMRVRRVPAATEHAACEKVAKLRGLLFVDGNTHGYFGLRVEVFRKSLAGEMSDTQFDISLKDTVFQIQWGDRHFRGLYLLRQDPIDDEMDYPEEDDDDVR